MKKYIFLSLLVIGVVVGIFYLYTSKITGKESNPWQAIPADASLIFEFHDHLVGFHQTEQSTLWPYLEKLAPIQRLNEEFAFFASVFEPVPGSNKKPHTLSSIHRTSSDDFGYLHIIDLKVSFNVSDLSAYLQADDIPYKTRVFRGTNIFEINHQDKSFVVSVKDDLILISHHPYLVESSIAVLHGGNNPITGTEKFSGFLAMTNKNKDPKVFAYTPNLHNILSIILDEEISGLSKNLSQIAGWIAMDYLFSEGAVHFNGYASKENLLTNAGVSHRRASSVEQILPYNTSLYYSYNSGKFNVKDDAAGDIFNGYFLNWIGDYFNFAITETFSSAYKNEVLLLVPSLDQDLARMQLTNLAQKTLDVSVVEPEMFKGHEIYQLENFPDLEAVLGLQSKLFSNPFFTILEEYVIFSNSSVQIKNLIENYLNGQVLSQEAAYKSYKRGMSQSFDLNVYYNTSRNYHLLRNFSSPSFRQYLEYNFGDIGNFNPVNFQFASINDQYAFVSGVIKISDGNQKVSSLLWKTELNEQLVNQPVVVINHTSQQKEILIQDKNNSLYLLNNNGEINWQIPLDSRIRGSVHQVDYYNNNRLQYLFATENSIFLIDRNGEFVGNFPIRLPSLTLNGISVFTYEGVQNYRMFTSCDNGNIYGFEKSGRPLPGWNPKRAGYSFDFPLQHFNAGGSDFILAANSSGKVLLYNRRGDLRIPEVDLKSQFRQPLISRKKGNSFELVNIDTGGVLYTIDNSGDFTTDTIGEFAGNVQAIIGERRIFLADDYRLYGYSPDFQPVFTYNLPEGIKSELISFRINDKEWIGFYHVQKDKIYLLDENGNLLPEFPLNGNSSFAIDHLINTRDKVVITGSADQTITTYRVSLGIQ